MAWKRKEKELTPEEAVALAKTELSRYWFGSSPLLAGVKAGNEFKVFPLEPVFLKKNWLIFFIDPTEFDGESILLFLKEWQNRYSVHELEILVIFIAVYRFLQSKGSIQGLIERFNLNVPTVSDFEEMLTHSFDISSFPAVLLMNQGKKYFVHGNQDWIHHGELDIQNFLRLHDAGLPLLPAFYPIQGLVRNQGRWEFGSQPRVGQPLSFPSPGFLKQENDKMPVAHFHTVRPNKLEVGGFSITGNWLQGEDCIQTDDPGAVIGFHSPSSHVAIVAGSKDFPSVEPSRMVVEVNGIPAYGNYAAEHLEMDDSGESIVPVVGPQLYHVLAQLPEDQREITLRFPDVGTKPITIYGIRFGEKESVLK